MKFMLIICHFVPEIYAPMHIGPILGGKRDKEKKSG